MELNTLTDALGRIIRTFSLHKEKTIHYPSYGIRQWIPFEVAGVVANREYKFDIPDDIEFGRMLVSFDIGSTPAGKITLKIYSPNSAIAEAGIELNMAGNQSNNNFTVDLATMLPPTRGGKVGSFTTTVNCKAFQLYCLPCFIGDAVGSYS